jgi:hypothetical protein
MSANLIYQMCRYSDNLYVEKISYDKRLQIFFVYAQSLLGSVFIIEFHNIEAYSNLDLTIAIYSIRKLPRVEMENVIRHSAYRRRQSCQPYVPAAFYPQENSWYSFLFEAESTPGP